MAYIVTSHRGQEVGRQNLTAALTVGRAGECGLCIHDILLSRKHCRLEHFDGHWTIVDLGSKNGTHVNGRAIAERQILQTGDRIQIGRSVVNFCAGVMTSDGSRKARPVDPWQARSRALFAHDLEEQRRECENMKLPVPRPAPRPPESFETDGVNDLIQGLLNTLNSKKAGSAPTVVDAPVEEKNVLRHLPRLRRAGFASMSMEFWLAAALAISATAAAYAVAFIFKT